MVVWHRVLEVESAKTGENMSSKALYFWERPGVEVIGNFMLSFDVSSGKTGQHISYSDAAFGRPERRGTCERPVKVRDFESALYRQIID